MAAAAGRIDVLAGQIGGSRSPAEKKPVTVIQVGLGPIGKRMVQDISERAGVVLTGAIDIDPAKVGRDVADVCGLSRGPLGVVVARPDALATTPGDVCIVTTVSKLEALAPMLERCILAGKHVVSSCEELAYPFAAQPALAARIDALAREHGVAVLGTGINPGFLMDTLPVLLSGLCRTVRAVRVERHQDARVRRLPFQQKIGAGLALAEWKRLRDAGKIKHVGFPQSLHLVAAALGWTLDRTEETVEPVLAEADASSPLLRVPAGACAGVRQTAVGYRNGEPLITLELLAFNGLQNPHDTVILTGEPSACPITISTSISLAHKTQNTDVRSSIGGGVHGDISTSAVIINCVQSVRAARPGLRTMVDIPVVHWTR